MGRRNPWTDRAKFCLDTGTQDVIMCIKFRDDRLRGFCVAGGQNSPKPIGFEYHPYNSANATACTVMTVLISLRLRFCHLTDIVRITNFYMYCILYCILLRMVKIFNTKNFNYYALQHYC